MHILNLNCQKGLNPNLSPFLSEAIQNKKYDFLLLQEASANVIKLIKTATKNNYDILRPSTKDSEASRSCVVYPKSYKVIGSHFFRFKDNYDENFFGVSMGAFKSKTESIIAVSVHLPAYLKPLKRSAALKRVKIELDSFIQQHSAIQHIILAGDFNSILPWENRRNKHILSPVMLPVKNRQGYTYHTKRVEPDSFSSAIIHWFGKIGLSLRMTLDHIFISETLSNAKNIEASSINIDVSDHLPILIEIQNSSK
jgi:endonuclease/exonuclease/phosphatase (EEP) superfamily protein YafD